MVDNNKVVLNKKDPRYDKLAKRMWLVEEHNNFHEHYWAFEQNLCVVELMVNYSGKHGIKM